MSRLKKREREITGYKVENKLLSIRPEGCKVRGDAGLDREGESRAGEMWIV